MKVTRSSDGLVVEMNEQESLGLLWWLTENDARQMGLDIDNEFGSEGHRLWDLLKTALIDKVEVAVW